MEIRRVGGPVRGLMMSGVAGGGGGGPVSRFSKMTIHDLAGQLAGKRVLVRVDFNVTDPQTGEIESDVRLRAALPTINFLREQGAIVILASHNGFPQDLSKVLMAEGMDKTSAYREASLRLSLKKAAGRLGELLKIKVLFLTGPDPEDPIHPNILPIIDCLAPGSVSLLENTRFYSGDEKGDMNLARRIVDSTKATIFVNDTFGSAHHDHASITGVAKVIRERGGRAVAGCIFEQEIGLLRGQELPGIAVLDNR